MDSLVRQSNEEIGNIVFTVNTKTVDGNSLLPCDGSKYLTKDYPVLSSVIDDKYKEVGIEGIEKNAIDWSDYINANTTVKVIGSNIYIFVSTSSTIGLITSNDSGNSFSELVPFNNLLASSNAPLGSEIKCNDAADILLVCKGWYSFVSKDRGITWEEENHYSGGVSSYSEIEHYDVSPSGQNMLIQSKSYNTNVFHMRSYDGGKLWQNDITVDNVFSRGSLSSRFGFTGESTLLVESGVNSEGTVVKVDFHTLNSSASLEGYLSGGHYNLKTKPEGAIYHLGHFTSSNSNHDSDRFYFTTNGVDWKLLPRLLSGGRIWSSYNLHLFGTLYDFSVSSDNFLYVCTESGVFRVSLNDDADNWVKVYDGGGTGLPINGIAKAGLIGGDVGIFSHDGLIYNFANKISEFEFFTPSLADDAFADFSKIVGDKI
ncbi:hypothetical protein H5119_02135 [Pseudoalteromonas sp. SG45-5]|uniref:hypothetical protein n=1 Tax=unclassified Pseudoalteromonas TaxID=194690 RepID=UPI0015F8E564|nr:MULTISPECIES: hypothetical protein [unclassified Pseudoalteromonas]MBB1384359.1 hypothetical protein [Pseudoalteromonas sp. SG45-5]MBB1392353.1 hypothetical protein [Pseudoalteromonas sp. SG44-4]MBB1446828.1 hypothetical protein [Pseudoalteromonas sp. SG41-6]